MILKRSSNVSKSETCETCHWFSAAHSLQHGYCKVDPPVLTHIDQETGHARFNNPVVSPHNFCSKWEDGE